MIGQTIRDARLAAGLTQKQVALSLGMTVQYLSDIENDRRRMPERYVPLLPEAMWAPVVEAYAAEHQAAITRLRSGEANA